ncbi:DUF2061 domain-containing protein [Ideonella margarita]|uniref:DUF2061 domain-containing protein n=1 Tax=Ideonella margarita TaxID=2984191 RepID=A0ABU9C4H8_9BURK
MAKSAAFGVMHVGIAFGVGYALTGSFAIAGALTIVEPLCNTVAHYFFDRWWSRREQAAALMAAGDGRQAAPVGEAEEPDAEVQSSSWVSHAMA